MKFCLICFAVYLSFSSIVEGRLLFDTQDTGHSYPARSTAKFICQDTDNKSPYGINWSFYNATFFRALATNGVLAPDLDIAKYKLNVSPTTLEINQLGLADRGNYTCCIKADNGETLLSATAMLNVRADNKTENKDVHAAHPNAVFLPKSNVFGVSAALHNLQPSPTAAYSSSIMTEKTVIPLMTAVVSTTSKPSTVPQQPPSCGNSSNVTDLSFTKEGNSPDLIIIKEGEHLELQCSYCLVSPGPANLSWYKEDREVNNNTYHTPDGGALTVPAVKHNRDEGLYECVVRTRTRNISTLITVIVDKVESNPLLSSISAMNMSVMSVQVKWRLTDHGLFTVTHVSLRLRPLNSSTWTHRVGNIPQKTGAFVFGQLQPASVYVLNVSLYDNGDWMDSTTVVFWTAASNTSALGKKSKVLYQVTNRRALGVALGIIGVLAIVVVAYACFMWCQDDKRGYSIPPEHKHSNDKNKENDSLFSTSSMYYNRAFVDEPSDWIGGDDHLLT